MTDIWRGLRDVTLRQLRTFRTVAARGNISAAARELHLTQPAVSMQLRELEDCCGVALYERAGRGIQLTEAGRELAAAAASVLETLRGTQERLDAMRGLQTGLLRLSVVSTAKYFAPAILAAFRSGHPGVNVQLVVGNREEVVGRIADNECDIAIMGRPPAEVRTEGCEFAPHPLVIIAAPGHPLARRKRIPFAELASEEFLVRERGSGTRTSMETLFSEQAVTYHTSMEVSSNETIKQAVIAGMGISLISAHTIALELATGRLVTLDVRGLPVMRAWHALYREGKRLSPAATAFLSELRERGAQLISSALQ
ncbi:MAG: LysR family transcriptional regulator [Halioglobus sp.]|jgi:LysR family transcriptional regulator, low CO2-responsive transcriptional regulator